MSNSCIFVMQSCDTANVMASPGQPGSTSPCDQRKRRWCPRNANVTANDQYRQNNYDVIWYYSLQVTWYPCDVMAEHNSQSNQGDERGLERSKRHSLCCLSTFTREQTFHVMYCVQWGAHATTSLRRRRRRQRWVLWAKQQFRCITFYRHCTTMTWDLLTRHFVKSMNTCRRIFLFSFFALNAVFSVQLQQNLPLTVKLTEKNANAFY